MNNLLNNPQFVVAVIALISALAAFFQSRSAQSGVTVTQQKVARHDQQLNGELDQRIATAVNAGIALYHATQEVPHPAVINQESRTKVVLPPTSGVTK